MAALSATMVARFFADSCSHRGTIDAMTTTALSPLGGSAVVIVVIVQKKSAAPTNSHFLLRLSHLKRIGGDRPRPGRPPTCRPAPQGLWGFFGLISAQPDGGIPPLKPWDLSGPAGSFC